MTRSFANQRAGVVAPTTESQRFQGLFEQPALQNWQLLFLDSLEKADFFLQMQACDVLIVDAHLLETGEDLAWLTQRSAIPVLVLSEDNPNVIRRAIAQGARFWLPRELVHRHPEVLYAALVQATRSEVPSAATLLTGGEEIRSYRDQVARLAHLLWQTTPTEARPCWFTQRYMLERLSAEVASAERYKSPLSVLVGEVRSQVDRLSKQGLLLNQWTLECVARLKRRGDVAGQYGPHQFILLLPHTTEEGARQMGLRLQRQIEHPTGEEFLPEVIRFVFGIASHSAESSSPKAILRQAEEQLTSFRPSACLPLNASLS